MSDLAFELEAAYGRVMNTHPGPWRVLCDHDLDEAHVLDARGDEVLTLPMGAPYSALAKLISLIPDVCDRDLRGSAGVKADIGRAGGSQRGLPHGDTDSPTNWYAERFVVPSNP